jgi:PAS domain S-box-containing protein
MGRLKSKKRRRVAAPRRTAAAVREGEQRLRAIVHTAVDAILTIDQRGIIDSVNPATERLFGYTAAELVGRNVKLLMPQPYRREHDRYLRSYLRTGVARIIGVGREVTALRKDGSTFPVFLAVSEIRLGQRRMFTGIIHDLTRRRQLERQVLEVATAEQRRIGLDLHDGLCQELVSLSLGLELVARKLAGGGRAAEAAELDKLGESLQSLTTQARQLAHGLNPVDVKGSGLPGALEQLAARVSDSTPIACTFRWDGRPCASDDAVATNLYRIAQEAVSNAIKHGRPTRIDLSLTHANGELSLRIEDNGRGMPDPSYFSTREAAAAAPALPAHADPSVHGGIGLQTMNYRARLIGATFEIHPAGTAAATSSAAAAAAAGATGSGTIITCSLKSDEHPSRASKNDRPEAPRRRHPK